MTNTTSRQSRSTRFIRTGFACLSAVLLLHSQRVIAGPEDPWEGGAWDATIIDWPHVAVSAANLPDGRVMTWSGSERLTWPTTEQTYTATWDPATSTFTEIFHPGHNMFCAHQVMLKDGRVFVNGGRNQTNSRWTSVFDYRTDSWTMIENMASGGRWYPTTVALENGDVMTSIGTASNTRYPDLWDQVTGWQVQNGIDFHDMVLDDFGGSHGESRWWPLLNVAPNGQIFHSGPTPDMHWIDPRGGVGGVGSYAPATLDPASDPLDWYFKHGTTVMYDEGKILTAGGWRSGGNPDSTNKAFTIDLTGTDPLVTLTNPMAEDRKFHNGVMLPTGEVLIIGGNASGSKFSDNESKLSVEIWDPNGFANGRQGTWRTGASMQTPRNYHSVALLLTDGRVLAAGGGYCSGNPTCNGATHEDGEIYSPPYLFDNTGALAPRPAITSGPQQILSGEVFTIQATPNMQNFSMIKMSSTTHGLNTDVRFLNVPFTELPAGSGNYELTANALTTVLTPGYWMLFALDSNGVPSEAHVVQANVDNLPSISPVPDQLSERDDVVSLQVVASDPDSDPITYSAAGLPPGLSIDSTSGLITGTVNGEGTYAATVIADDNDDGSTSSNFKWIVVGSGLGAIRRDWWTGISGTAVSALTSDPDYPAAPDGTEILGVFEGPTNVLENYGSRMHGYLEPDIDGQYTFYIASDDNSELWLSTDNDPLNKVLIANVPGWTTSREWTKFAEQQSVPVSLLAGERYFIEAIQKEGGGGDNLAVAWVKPGQSTPEVITGANLALEPVGAVTLPETVATGTLSDVGSDWTVVSLPRTYDDMVVVATPVYSGFDLPAITRVRNAVGNQFEVRVQNPSDTALSGYTVHYVVSEAGVYAGPGIAFEAVKFDSSVTDHRNSWIGEARSYAQTYTNPVVVGQVMTDNDSLWSVFWARGSSRAQPPSATEFYAGKHVGEDPNTVRANETIGYLVFESGFGALGSFGYEAGVGTDIVEGVTEAAAPWNYPLQGSFDTAVLSSAAMDARQGAWPLLVGIDPLAGANAVVAVDEDQVRDNERGHATEQVAFLAISGDIEVPVEVDPVITMPVVTGGLVEFEVVSNSPELLYSYSFGDGTPPTPLSNDPTAQHIYSAPGRYIVIITIIDPSNGNEYSQTIVQLIHNPLTANLPTKSSSIVVNENLNQVWNVNPDNDTVTVIDSSTYSKLGEVLVGERPSGIAIASSDSVWVTNKGSHSISVVDSGSLSLINTIPMTPYSMPHGIVMHPTLDRAYVVLEGTGELVMFDTISGTELSRSYLGPNVKHASVTFDGASVLVSRFVTPPLPDEATAAPIVENAGVFFGADVLAVDANTLATQNQIVLQHSDRLVSEHSGPGVPNYLGAAAISPDGLAAWIPSKQDNVLGGALRGGDGMTHDQTVRAVSSKVELGTAAEDFPARIDHDNASVGSQATFGPWGAYMFTSLEGNREIAVSDVYSSTELLRFDVGRAPQGLVTHSDGNTLFVHNFMDRTVSVFDISSITHSNVLSVTPLATVATVASESLTAEVFTGKQIFYDARDPRIALESYMSCASCHADGGQDGRVWDFTCVGDELLSTPPPCSAEGLRNTIDLQGRAGMAHGALHWSANFDEVQDFENQLRGFAGGTGLMSDVEFQTGTRSQTLGDPKAGISADLDALAAYVASLTSYPDSPYRNTDGTLTPDGELGLAIFERENCAQCHTLLSYTDSSDGSGLHDVGTLTSASGSRLGGPLDGIDTPTLISVWQSAPYLHDGSAQDVTEAVLAHTSLGLSLTSAELDQLGAYLDELDGVTRTISNNAPQSPVQFGSVTTIQPNAATWLSVNFESSFLVTPIVVMGPPSANDLEPMSIRVRNVTTAGFEFQLDEWEYLDGVHGVETVAWLAVEPGVHDLGGITVEAGQVAGVTHGWGNGSMGAGFVSPPVVLAQTASMVEATGVGLVLRNISTTGFQVKLREEDAQDGSHAGETVNFIALSAGTGVVNGAFIAVGTTADTIDHNWETVGFGGSYPSPLLFGTLQQHQGKDVIALRHRNLTATQFDIFVEEETSLDSEVEHSENPLGWLVISDQ